MDYINQIFKLSMVVGARIHDTILDNIMQFDALGIYCGTSSTSEKRYKIYRSVTLKIDHGG